MEIAKCNPEQLCIITCKNIINTFECTIFTQLSAKNNQLNFRINRKKIFFEAPWEVVRLYMKKKKLLQLKQFRPTFPKPLPMPITNTPFSKNLQQPYLCYMSQQALWRVFFSLCTRFCYLSSSTLVFTKYENWYKVNK